MCFLRAQSNERLRWMMLRSIVDCTDDVLLLRKQWSPIASFYTI